MIILDTTKSDVLRRNYIKNFVDVASTYYKENIAQKTRFSDGLCYTGYLWDCLLNPCIILESEADRLLNEKRKVFIMWDIHSSDRILIPNYWKFPKTNVLSIDVWEKKLKDNLPEDVYVFDNTFSWSIIYTHETDIKNNRYCLFVNKDVTDKSVFG